MKRTTSAIFFFTLLLTEILNWGCSRVKEENSATHESAPTPVIAPERESRPKFADKIKNNDVEPLVEQKAGHAETIPLGPIFKPASIDERNLEYTANLTYQINDLKTARTFFSQWIPRYGFLVSETTSGYGNGYLSIQVKVRSSQLYTALTELDSIGTLATEQITAVDHTGNFVFRQLQAAREEIRLRRRAQARNETGTQSRNWQITESLLSSSEDKDLQLRMEEWRLNDRVKWATISLKLQTPAATHTAPIEVPHFRNAFIGILNILLQVLYVCIYLIPLLLIAWGGLKLALWIYHYLQNTKNCKE
ncbi:MAG: hypothetical protein LDLANPLL_01919 [Turneriella sp.]|nr:hypothetical protein [Turneriella sp.]